MGRRGRFEQLLGPADCYLGRDGQVPKEAASQVLDSCSAWWLPLRRAQATARWRACSAARLSPRPQLADRQPRLGQALQVAAGLQYRRSRLARLDSFGVGAALRTWISACRTPIRACPRTGPDHRGNLQALGEGGLGLLQVAGRIQHRPQQPVQVGAQPWIGGVRRERAFQPALPLLEQSAGQPEPAQRAGQPRPGLAAADGQGVAEGGAEVVLLTSRTGSSRSRSASPRNASACWSRT